MAREIRLTIPDQIYARIVQICKEANISPQDIIMRAIVKVIEEFEKIGKVKAS